MSRQGYFGSGERIMATLRGTFAAAPPRSRERTRQLENTLPLVDPFDLVKPDRREDINAYFGDVHKTLDQEMDEQWKLVGPTEPPGTIFHYTTPGGLLGIVERHAIYLTDAFFLNDQSELIYGRDLALEVLEERRSTAVGAVAEFLKVAIAKFDPFNADTGFRYYVACFCSNGNLLSQWRAYAEPGSGFALGFDPEPLGAKHFVGDVPHVVLHRMEYSQQSQRQLLRFVTDRVCERMASDHARARSQFSRDLIMSGYFAALMMQMVGLFPQFKHPVFEEEQEWRLSTPRMTNEYRERIQFRESEKNIVPFMSLDLRVKTDRFVDQLPLTVVRHAPTAEPELKKRSVETFLSERGYAHVPVEGSGIPLRW